MAHAIRRGEMAKMIVIFLQSQSGYQQTLVENPACARFNDLTSLEEADIRDFIITACQMQLMGMEANGVDVLRSFRPNETISKAEVGVLLSRILRGQRYAGEGLNRYQGHLKALEDALIIDPIPNPLVPELRGNVMLMLMKIQVGLQQ